MTVGGSASRANDAGVRLASSLARRPVYAATVYSASRCGPLSPYRSCPVLVAESNRVNSSADRGRRFLRMPTVAFTFARCRNGLVNSRSVFTSQLPNAFTDFA